MKIVLVMTAALLGQAVMAADIPTPATPAADPDKKICRSLDPAIGSNISRRVCKTKAEWAAQSHASTADTIDANKFRDTATLNAIPH